MSKFGYLQIEHIFLNFIPTGKFIAMIKKGRQRFGNNAIRQAALYDIKYGGSRDRYGHLTTDEVDRDISDLGHDFLKAKQEYQMVKDLIGLRAVFCSFALLKSTFLNRRGTPNNLDYSKWFVNYLNVAYEEEYFNQNNKLLLHIAVGSNGKIGQRYKWEVQKGDMGYLFH